MPKKFRLQANSALAERRRRLRCRGLKRVDVQLFRADTPTTARGPKELVASAPLDGIELDRTRDTGRSVDL